MKAFFHRHRHRLALGLIAGLIVLTLLWRFFPGHPLDQWREWVQVILGWVRSAPFPVFILMVGLLPMVGVPVTSLYLAAGAAYVPVYGFPVTLLGLALGLALNLTLSYAAARWFRGPVNRWLQRFGTSVPTFAGLPPWKIILLVRITPGAPLMVHNLLLGLARVPFGWYIGISLLTEILIAAGYLTAGHSFSSGRWELLALGIGVVAVAVLLASLLRDRMKGKRSEDSSS